MSSPAAFAAVASLAADQASARSGWNVVSNSVQPAIAVSVKLWKKSPKLSFFMASSDGSLVEIPSNDVGTNIRELKAADLLARCEERHVDDVSKFAEGVAVISKGPEKRFDRTFRRGVVVKNQQSAVCRTSRRDIAISSVDLLQKSVESRHDLFKSLKDRVGRAVLDRRVRLANRLSENLQALVSRNDFDRFIQEF